MKIAYVAHIRLPTEKAHGYQIMRVCAEWAKAGHEVVLYVPKRHNHITQDAFAFYGLEQNFSLQYVPCRDWMRWVPLFGRSAFFAQSYTFLRALRHQLSGNKIVYTRDIEAVWYLSRWGYQCVFNAHTWPRKSRLATWLISGAKGAVCNSKGTELVVRAATGLPTVVAYNAADSNPYVGQEKGSLRTELGLPVDKKIALYSGHLYGWKGASALVECARVLKQGPNLLIVCVGGTKEDVKRLEQTTTDLHNIQFLGHKQKEQVPKYLAAADVLVLPNTAATQESVQFTSPLKLFEYMASGTPIVASDLPSLKEVLSDTTAFFSKPGSGESLARAVTEVLSNTDEAQTRARASMALSLQYTWDAHAQKTLSFIESVTS